MNYAKYLSKEIKRIEREQRYEYTYAPNDITNFDCDMLYGIEL